MPLAGGPAPTSPEFSTSRMSDTFFLRAREAKLELRKFGRGGGMCGVDEYKALLSPRVHCVQESSFDSFTRGAALLRSLDLDPAKPEPPHGLRDTLRLQALATFKKAIAGQAPCFLVLGDEILKPKAPGPERPPPPPRKPRPPRKPP